MTIDIHPGLNPEDLLGPASHPSPMTDRDDIISVQRVSKMYPLYDDPRDRLKQSLWYALPEFFRGQPRQFYREFWALQDISFTLKKGQTVGIVGRNGSGKSTLLQIVAGTLAPTSGNVTINGRVTALLELGSGFNPEFTGRENVFLNGSILGLSREEMDSYFDEIAAFADIGDFIDQPVKLYSSGMLVRLAFAVQAVVPKQTLIVDEALAVGDIAFQRKCMRLMEEFQAGGGSVLLVTHDTQTINRWCQKAILLEAGELLLQGKSKMVTDIYEQLLLCVTLKERQALIERLRQQTRSDATLADDVEQNEKTNSSTADLITSEQTVYDPNLSQIVEKTYGDGRAEIIQPQLIDERGQAVNVVVCGQRYYWRYRIRFKENIDPVHVGMSLKRIDGVIVYVASNVDNKLGLPPAKANDFIEITFRLDLNLTPNTYYFNCGVSTFENGQLTYLHRRVDVMAIRVIPPDERMVDGIAYLNHHLDYHLIEERD